MDFKHIPVLLNEAVNALDVKEDGVYFDGTLGGGGHSLEILKQLSNSGRLIAVDRDSDALISAGERLKEHKNKIDFVHDNFKNAEDILNNLNISQLDGVLLDLGVSSYQIDSAERGFSYMKDAPLDMRMNQCQYLTAFNVINEYSVSKLTRIFYEYGEERFAKKIAERIALEREKETIRTTSQLASLVEKCYPAATRWKYGHPAKRVFQAVRIEVNGELEGLYDVITALCRRLKSGGRIVVISFHSLEDRIVKTCFKELESDCTCDKSLPVCVCGKKQEVKILTKKPITASLEELKNNPRAESAKLRVAERV